MNQSEQKGREKLTIDVAIATHGDEGLEKVSRMHLPQEEGVTYIVSWQQHNGGPVPPALGQRKDIRILRLDEPGLSNNRNNAIDHGSSDIVLIADNDEMLLPDFAETIREAFEKNPQMALGVFKADLNGNRKTYPSESRRLGLPFPKNFYVMSIEIAFRRRCIGDLRFYPGMGLGSGEMTAGEDELFAISAIKRGLDVRFVDEMICRHPQPSTGEKMNEGALMASGFIISILYPGTALPRIALKAWRVSKKGEIKFLKAFKALSRGGKMSRKSLSRIPGKYRW